MIDIDHFKRINDTHGHQTGDEVLMSVAQLISGSVRKSDLVGRYGGEEFLVFLPQVDGRGLRRIAEKVRSAVERGTREWLPATVSVGAASTDFAEGVEPGLASLIRLADRHLYRAKSDGRNRVVANHAAH
jgi:diguanylate cyclase (GGDEF)-like protein